MNTDIRATLDQLAAETLDRTEPIPDGDLAELRTLQDVANYVDRRRGG